MIVEQIKNKVMTLKLVTGEEVITKIVEELSDRYRVEKPLAFIMQKVGPAMAPMFLSVEWEKHSIDIMKNAVTMIATPKDEMVEGYKQVTSKIVVPPKPKIIT